MNNSNLFGFESHLAGHGKEASFLVQYQGKNTVQYRDTAVQGNGEYVSFYETNSHYLVIYQNEIVQGAMIVRKEFGFGMPGCSVNDLTGWSVDELEVTGKAVSFSELNVDEDLVDVMKEAITDGFNGMVKLTRGWNALMIVSESDYQTHIMEVRKFIENL